MIVSTDAVIDHVSGRHSFFGSPLALMLSSASPFFPPELERDIFECAAASHPETIPNLLVVSHRVREW
jgi:hypothetical protein